MRKVTQAEAEQWIKLAREHGHADDEGRIALGRFVVEKNAPPGMMRFRFVTPLLAGLYVGTTLAKKTPPIMFDRTPAGSIIIPGRWWQAMFERLSEDGSGNIPSDAKANAAKAARSVSVNDIHMPPDTDTIEFSAPDEDGNLVVHEALPPGGEITFRYVIGGRRG